MARFTPDQVVKYSVKYVLRNENPSMYAVSDLFATMVTAYADEREQKNLNDLLELPQRFQLLVEELWIAPICFLRHILQHSGIKQ